jgi:hypothetical protein
MKAKRKLFDKLKVGLDNDDITSARVFLETQATESDLETLKSQKILLKCKNQQAQQELVEAYENAAKRLCSDSGKAEELKLYAQYAAVAARILTTITEQVSSYKHVFSKISLLDLLEIANELLVQESREHWDSMWADTENRLHEHNTEHVDNSDLSEWTLHEISGHINDMVFSTCKAINEASRWVNHNKKGVSGQALREKATEAFRSLITLASKWNAIEYSLDRVSYGEWVVKSLNPEIPEIVFDQVDVKLLRARTLGIRRLLVKRYVGRTFSLPSRQAFESLCHALTQNALTFYESQTRDVRRSYFENMDLSERIARLLDFLDTDDDFLVVISIGNDHPEMLSHYLAVIGLQSCALSASFIKEKMSRKYRRQMICPIIPADLIVDTIASTGLSRQAIHEALSRQVVTLPMGHYLDLMARPFVRLPNRKIVCLDALINVNWASGIRRLVEGGAIADTYGKVWERYVEDLLQRYKWRIVGRGIKLKNNHGHTATDIDILALKNDLLLVIQVKAIFSEGITPYDQWKARRIIVKGAEQAQTACEILTSDHSRAISIVGKRVFRHIKHIQPLVVTNDVMFTGWNYNDIPTISVKALISHLRGAIVEFKSLKGEVISSQRFSKSDELTTEEFIDLLNNPLDWRIAKDSDTIEYIEVDMGIMKCHYPSLKRVDFLQ